MNTVSLTEIKEILGEDVFEWIKQTQEHVTDETQIHVVEDEATLPRPMGQEMYPYKKSDGTQVLLPHFWNVKRTDSGSRTHTSAYVEDENLLLIWPD